MSLSQRFPRYIVDRAYLYLGPVEHQPAEACQFGDVCEGLRLEAVAGGQVELLQPGTRLRDDLQAGLVQEVAARQLQGAQALTAGLHEADGGNRCTGEIRRATYECTCPYFRQYDFYIISYFLFVIIEKAW